MLNRMLIKQERGNMRIVLCALIVFSQTLYAIGCNDTNGSRIGVRDDKQINWDDKKIDRTINNIDRTTYNVTNNKANLLDLQALWGVYPTQDELYSRYNDAIYSVLQDTTEYTIPEFNCDITYFFADMKFDGKNIKVCEFGPSTHAGLTNSLVLINDKLERIFCPYWCMFWKYLEPFQLPMWYVGRCSGDMQKKMDMSLFSDLGGKRYATLKDLEDDDNFQKLVSYGVKKNPLIKDYHEVVIYRRPKGAGHVFINEFKKKYPQVLIVNDTARYFVSSKHQTANLFKTEELQKYRPESKTYPKVYTSNLAQKIISEIPSASTLYVIKPVRSLQSKGIIVTEQKDLDKILQLILRDTHKIKDTDHRCFTYWKTTKSTFFVVEEFAISKNITVDGKRYDPTMRIVFALSHEHNTIRLNIFGGFWKIPLKSIDDTGTLVGKHVTIPYSGEFYVGIPINKQDMTNAKKILKKIIPKVYVQMLKKYPN